MRIRTKPTTATGVHSSPHRGGAIPAHVGGLLKYLSQPEEKANEDLALAYFRVLCGDAFSRQGDAQRCDGYVAGSFVLELKGKSSDWLNGFFQALAYKKKSLDFSQIVVGAKDFLALWRVDDIDQRLREEVLAEPGAPSAIGGRLAKRHAARRNEILKLAIWNGAELSGSLFLGNPEVVVERIETFEKALKDGRKVRLKITPNNFPLVLKEMRQYFDPRQPVKTVRAFYSMAYAWDETSTVVLSQKASDQATLGGAFITNLDPAKRSQFKDFAENHYVYLGPTENIDDFFARYDEAIDAVARDFRIKHGMFFTDLYLSKFVMWLVKQHIPNLGKDYLVIDPACGSGNLVTNWRSPLELRHKVVSEIEPELLFAVEQRMKGDQWHNGKFTVIPKVSENIGLNFLDRSATEYLAEMTKYLAEKGQKANKPLAFLCNPPYRSDDDQAAGAISYKVHDSIGKLTGNDAESERYCCFLAQMKLICEAASSSGLPGDSLLLLFTKSAWLTRRAVFKRIRSAILASFENVAGILVDGSEFFHVKGAWPVAFTVWRYKGADAKLNPDRGIPLIDLTWLRREQLFRINWNDHDAVEQDCTEIKLSKSAITVEIGEERTAIRSWTGETMTDFKRDRRKSEINSSNVGGLPHGDLRQAKRKAYGEPDGKFIGFMDNLTPCRVKRSVPDRPWFRLNGQFMDAKKNRCFSGPPDNRGYCARDLESAKKLCFWYALARTFLQHPYPMWVDADDMWQPFIPNGLERQTFQTAFAITFAENECVEAVFPANDPIAGAPELFIKNPLTPLNWESFWSTTMKPFCVSTASPNVSCLLSGVDQLFTDWKHLFKNRSELHISGKPYLLGTSVLTQGAGIIQIKDYAKEANESSLLQDLSEIQRRLKSVKTEFNELCTAGTGLNYFGSHKIGVGSVRPDRLAERVPGHR